MNRYNLISSTHGISYRLDQNGEWVKYDDVKLIITEQAATIDRLLHAVHIGRDIMTLAPHALDDIDKILSETPAQSLASLRRNCYTCGTKID